MKLFRAMLFVLAIVCSDNSDAVTAMGTPSCASWNTGAEQKIAFDTQASTQMPWDYIAKSSWLSGYLSGRFTSMKSRIIDTVDIDSINLWMNKYCNAHPLDDLQEGAESLIVELKKRKK